jgi:three-Cys-motif partner protein
MSVPLPRIKVPSEGRHLSANDSHFKQKKAAAILKHAALANYLMPFATMTSTTSEGHRVWFIDAYAGRGRYEPELGEAAGKPGSPLIALGIGNTIRQFKNPRNLHCAFIERKPEYAASLRDIVSSGRFPRETIVVEGDAVDHLGSVLSQVKNDPLLTFLDPFGTALPRDFMMKTLFARNESATNEVLLNFHLLSVARIGGLMAKGAELSEPDLKTVARLDAFIGSEAWRNEFLNVYEPGNEGSATDGAQAVARLFRAQLKNESGYDSFPLEIRKGIKHKPIFELTLFYRRTIGEYKFADAASIANTAWRRWISEQEMREDAERFSDALFGAEFSEAQFSESFKRSEESLSASWVDSIRKNMVDLLARDKRVVVSQRVRELYGDTIGLAGEKHLRRAWVSLEKSGHVDRHPSDLYSAVMTAQVPISTL